MRLNALQRRRLANFRANRRAFWSLWIFLALFTTALFAEFVANDRPLAVRFQGEWRFPIFQFYSEADFGGEFQTQAEYNSPEVRCLIATGGMEVCLDDPEGVMAQVPGGMVDGERIANPGRAIWPLIPYSFNTINYDVASAPSAPDRQHWLGTDDQTRDVLARVIYGFRISILFALVVAGVSALIGVAAGAVQGYFGGWIDLFFQRIVEIWVNMPSLYVIIILSAIFTMNFWLLTLLIAFFSWTSLVGVVRAEFLRARNFEYVRAARALGVGDGTIMVRHLLPNAMVATLTLLPFIITGAIGGLAALDFLGLGLPPSYPSLGELALQAKNRLNAPWLGFTAFFTFATMLSLLVFIFEGVRDAFDPRKTFR
ncbi:ABC transporter permease [Amaricoccus sp.]|uniref:ABC transporter permease n=1 Tax=Amaricoccus sp. TaxID=1872485 RepID=UPI001B55E91D|nr:ABC transporter permease [Amaricoccus sp.]MBP7242920.1 ABC transporter permease [Amaricoccus sp.]